MVKIFDGKKVAGEIAKKLTKEIFSLPHTPTLAIIQVGDRPDSNTYVRHKKSFGEKIGAKVEHILFPNSISEKEVILKIHALNRSPHIHGIIVQIPLPHHLNKDEIISEIDPKKDVDGLTTLNQGLMFQEKTCGFVPATPKGVLTLLKRYKVPLKGKRALVIGRSLLVGKPLAMLLLGEDATVTIAHRYTKNLHALCKENDIIVSAVGSPEFLGKRSFRKGQYVIDIGTNAVKGKKIVEEMTITKHKLVGDVKFDEVSKIVAMISPVPGGVGPMTVATLFENLIEAAKIAK
ncbi:MAG TPA: bifunctional 5,10-methylenetetrahydrofolate dehydrogenase/5,10-methenyltetrahydrofolate cyclohydrolase [Candidatus Paceibacterota bacterium]